MMAEKIQGELVILHKVEAGTPTASTNPTEQTGEDNFVDAQETDVNKDDLALKGLKKVGGRVSIQRRLANYTITAAERFMNRQFDNAIFKESLYGDSRSMAKKQNIKMKTNQITNTAKSLVGASITSAAVGNFWILGLQAGNMVANIMSNQSNAMNNNRNFEERARVDMFESNKRRERVIVNTYNRR